MNTSQIKQSIHAMSSSKINHQRISKNKISIINQPPRQFLEHYDENIKLKRKQDQMQKLIKQLQDKLKMQMNINKTFNENQIRKLATSKKQQLEKTLNKTTGRLQSAYKTNNNHNKQNVQNLLQIIDHYKERMLLAEAEINNLKRQKLLLEQDLSVKERKVNQIVQIYGNQEHVDHSLEQKLRTATRQFQLEKQRCKHLEADIKRLEAKVRSLQLKNEEHSQLKIINKGLQQKIMKMTNMNQYIPANDNVDYQTKIKQLEQKLKNGTQKYQTIKDNNIKLQAEVKALKTKLIEVNFQCDTLQKANNELQLQSFQNPIFQRLSKDPQLLLKVLSEIEDKKLNRKEQPIGKFQFQKILMEKEQLAKQLILLRAKIKMLEQGWKEKQKIHQIQKKQIISTLQNQTKVQKSATTANGVIYDDDVSVFSQKKISIPEGTNYFDLYISQINLLQTNLKALGTLQNYQNPLIIATVDFYNHNTMHSELTQGLQCDLKSQFQFKVTQDEFFFKYLNKGNLQIDIWGSQGNKHHNLGKVSLELKPLVTRCRPKIAPVVSISCPIYLNQKVMGSISLIMRIRLPIYEKIQKISSLQSALVSGNSQKIQNRKLVIQIQQGRGFGDKANTFVYFNFRLQDYYTKTYRGSNPIWNYFKMIEVKYNDDLKNYLRKNDFELTVFDDNAVINDDKNSDVVGCGIIPLISLLQNKHIKQRVQIRKNRQLKGTVQVKVFWHEVQKIQQLRQLKQKNTVEVIHETIQHYLKQKGLTAEYVFKSIDNNKSDMISFSEFNEWLRKLYKEIKKEISSEQVSQYYNTITQPVNIINFVIRIEQQQRKDGNDLMAQFGMINKFFKNNTVQIKKKKTLRQYLKQKDLITVSLEIDKDQNGKITRAELLQYFDAQGVQVEVKENQIQLIDFLKKYQDCI